MKWNSLGTKKPILNWQLYDIPVIGVELFRVTNHWNILPYYRMKGYLGQFFSTTTDVVQPITIYPIKGVQQLIELPIPQDLKNAGNITRYIGIKLAFPFKTGNFGYDWMVELEEYIGE